MENNIVVLKTKTQDETPRDIMYRLMTPGPKETKVIYFDFTNKEFLMSKTYVKQ